MYNKENIFAKIIDGAIPTEKLYEDEMLIAIRDINPAAPVHILVIPKGEFIDFADFVANASRELIAHYYQTIAKIAKEHNAGDYRLVTNRGKGAGQSVFHFHTHIIGGREIKGLIDNGL